MIDKYSYQPHNSCNLHQVYGQFYLKEAYKGWKGLDQEHIPVELSDKGLIEDWSDRYDFNQFSAVPLMYLNFYLKKVGCYGQLYQKQHFDLTGKAQRQVSCLMQLKDKL